MAIETTFRPRRFLKTHASKAISEYEDLVAQHFDIR